MAPPKRKMTGGRVTPKGGAPTRTAAATAGSSARGVGASTRYTPPTPASMEESPRWLPILMALLIVGGVVCIILRYLVWQDSNLPVLVGLVLLLGGLLTATKWR